MSLVVPLSVSAGDFPSRKTGLCEIQTVIRDQGFGQTMKQCVDVASDAKMMQMGKNMSGAMGANCVKNEFRKQGSNFVSETDCAMGEMRMISKTVFSGNFSSEYAGDTTVRYEPALMGMSEQRMKITARWLGPCEAGQKPGDIIMPNGMKMNMNSLGTLGNGAK